MERYTCPRELLPVVESALAAEGYEIAAPLQRAVGGARTTVMTRGAAVITLHEDAGSDMADINVYNNGDQGGLAVLETLPLLFSTSLDRPRPR